jgi:RHS repeat-associated protein
MIRRILLFTLFAIAFAEALFAQTCPSGASWCSGTYSYDAMGNIRAIGADTYVYDTAGRLVSGTADVQRTGVMSRQDYSYDAFGNRTAASRIAGSVNCPGGCELSPAIDPLTNHITGSGAQYDAAGNLIFIQDPPDATYTYDAAGSLVHAVAGTDDRQFLYTADDERIATANGANGATWTWTVRGLDGKVLREFTSSQAPGGLPTSTWQWTKDYVWRDGLLLASVTPTTSGGTATQHFHLDHLGTPRLVTGDNGVQLSVHAYYPFGAELNLTPTEQPAELMKFTGHERDLLANDAHTLDYMHARYEMGTLGRFLSIDPAVDLKQNIHVPQRWNRYTYALNGSIRYIDPNGKDTMDSIRSFRIWVGFTGGAHAPHGQSAGRYAMSHPEETVALLASAGLGAAAVYGPEALASVGQGALSVGRAALFQLQILSSGATSIMLGQTMSRVQNAADETGSLTFETDATELQTMWQQNKAWLDAAIKFGYKILDIGSDPRKLTPGTFHPMEEQYLMDQGFQRAHAGWAFVQGELVEIFQWVPKAK